MVVAIRLDGSNASLVVFYDWGGGCDSIWSVPLEIGLRKVASRSLAV